MSAGELLLVLGVLAVATTAVLVAAVHVARRAAEVHPRRRVGAPLRWLVSPTRPAALHRRLRGAVRRLRLDVGRPRRRNAGPLDELAAEVTALAVAVDRELVVASHRPWDERRLAWAGLAHRVAQVSALADEVRALAAGAGRPAATRGAMTEDEWLARADRLRRRTEAHQAAQAEVDDLERRLGLG